MATTKVNTEFIAVNAISGTIIADGAITSTHLAANCVDSSELVTGSIDTIHIAANQVTATKIVTNGVLTRHISDDQVTADKIASATIVSGNIANNAILTQHIDDNQINIDQLNVSDGSSGQALTTNGSGTLSFSTISGGVDGISTSADATAITIDSSERIMIGSTTSAISANAQKLQIANAGATSVYHSSVMLHSQQNDGNANVNRISWSGGDGASSTRVFSSIEGGKENSTSGEYGGMISMSTRPHGGTKTERMRITSAGSVGINETSPDFSGFGSNGGGLELDDVGSSFTAVRVNQGGTGDFYLAVTTGAAYLWGKANSPTLFGTNNTEKMRLDESGSLGLGTNNPGSLLHVAHSNGGANPTARIENTTGTVATNSVLLDLKFSGDDSFSNCDYLRFQDSSGEEGVITGDGGGRVYYEINSDYRLKENVLDYSGGLNKIKALSVKRYNYKTRPGTTYTGFLAHEVAEVVDGVARGTKDAVNPDGTPDYQGMDLSKLVPELVSAIQELEARVKTLEG